MKVLSGSDIASYVKQRQLGQFRRFAHEAKRPAGLAIIQVIDDPVIDSYVRAKQRYGSDLEVNVDVHRIKQPQALELIDQLNASADIDGIIVQLPLENDAQRQELLDRVDTAKDVDGLASGSSFIQPTPQAILWLLEGYNIELHGQKILVVGLGQLVGAPLVRMLQSANLQVITADSMTEDLGAMVGANDIIISATGAPGLISAEMVASHHTIIDAGVASDKGVAQGDVDPKVYSQNLATAVSASRGGVGPLTVSALFENLLHAANQSLEIEPSASEKL